MEFDRRLSGSRLERIRVYMICLKCGRKLKSELSMDVGYGPVCYRKVFGISQRDRRKDNASESVGTCCYDIPGQMTIEEYLQMDSK